MRTMVESNSGHPGAAAAATDPLVGKVLNGRFTVLEPIGTGGMGRVYKALQAPLDRVVALKVLNPHYGSGKDPGFQKRFFLEASMTSKLRHPNTITIIDYGKTDDGIFYIAMEYVEGQTLGQILTQQGALPWARALNVGQQICRSLREAHRMGIVHRDLKPANVMLLQEEADHDQVKVLDFGLVKSFTDRPKAENEVELTQSGVLLGSPQYMAPEQARGNADPRSDIYSLGVMMYQMLAGKPPFVGRESIDVIVKHIREPPPPLRAPRTELEFPGEVAAMVMRCLEKEPAKRYQTMDEVLEAMRRAGVNAGLSGVFADPRSQPISQTISGSRVRRAAYESNDGPSKVTPSLEEVAITDTGVKTSQPPTRKILIGAVVAVLSVGAGVAGVLTAMRADPPAAPAPTEAPVVMPAATRTPPEERRPAPQPPVLFYVTSDPAGARVTLRGRPMGTTPLQFELPREGDEGATAQLTFTLDGYQSSTITAHGTGPEVQVRQRLEKKPSPPPVSRPKASPKSKANAYKDDPYQ